MFEKTNEKNESKAFGNIHTLHTIVIIYILN